MKKIFLIHSMIAVSLFATEEIHNNTSSNASLTNGSKENIPQVVSILLSESKKFSTLPNNADAFNLSGNQIQRANIATSEQKPKEGIDNKGTIAIQTAQAHYVAFNPKDIASSRPLMGVVAISKPLTIGMGMSSKNYTTQANTISLRNR